MSATPLAAVELAARGRPVTACPTCRRVSDPRRSYAGHRTNRTRRYCAPECKTDARNARARARTAYRQANAAILRMRAEEARGQLPIPELPPLPTPTPFRDPVAVTA